ncbi:MAG: branched-chain amino acid ABC transporter substrate-binding protein [Candidatus Zixiibacteriota bacterium]
MKNVRTVVTALAATALLVAGSGLFACKKKEPETIKIAIVTPLTGDGAVYGVPQKNAAEIAVNEINENGGLLGRKVELLPYDDKADPKEAVTIANKVVTLPGITGVVGHPNSGNAIPASKIYKESGLPYVVTSATNPEITRQGFENVFRFAPTDDMQGISAARFISETLGVDNVAVIHDNAAYGKGIADNVKQESEKLGLKVVLYDALNPGQKEYRAIIEKLKGVTPAVVFYGGMAPEGAKLVKQAKELGLETTFVMGDGCFDEKLPELAGTDCKNVCVSFLAPPWGEVGSAKGFVEEYKRDFGDVPAFAPYGYDAVKVLAAGISKAESQDHEAIIEALRAPGFSVEGVTGKITFDDNGQTTDRSFYFYTFGDDGRFKLYGR